MNGNYHTGAGGPEAEGPAHLVNYKLSSTISSDEIETKTENI
jgi:hypothetical protein